MDDTAKLIATVLLASFAIERVTAAFSYFFEAQRLQRLQTANAAELRAAHRRKLALLVVAGAIALGVVFAVDIRILRVLKMTAPASVDFALTWLVLFAGADRIREFLQKDEGPSKSAEVPLFRLQVPDDSEVSEITRAS